MIENFGRSEATYWGNALAGETGEACNLIKKAVRDRLEVIESGLLAAELADIFIYLELTARYFTIDLEPAIISKIAIVNHVREMLGQGNKLVECEYCGKEWHVKKALVVPSFRDEEEIPTNFLYFCNRECQQENEAEEQALGQEVLGGY